MKFILFTALSLLLVVGCGDSYNFFEDYSEVMPKKEAIDSAFDWAKLQNRNGVAYLPNANKPFTGFAMQSYENEQIGVLARFADGFVVRLKQWQENGIPKWDVGYVAGKVGVDQIANGGLEELLFFHNEGLATVWYENGQKKAEFNWKDGRKNGLFTVWYENGQKKTEANWKDGQKNGSFSGWFENGQKNWESNWKEGVKDGLWCGWYGNGIKERESYWKEGVKEGLWIGWYKNGRKARETYWKKGKFMTSFAWKPSGEKCPLTDVKDGNGVVVRYCEDGRERSRLTYKNGETVED